MALNPMLGNIRFPRGFHLLILQWNQLVEMLIFPCISSQFSQTQGRRDSMNSVCSHPQLLEHQSKSQIHPNINI